MLPIALLPTTADQAPLIRNLYQFYSYESSDWEQEDVEVDGRFYIHDEHLHRYWQDDGWGAYLVLADGFIAGFVLVERSELPGIDALELADLFILKVPPPGHRPGGGVAAAGRRGRLVAAVLRTRCPGRGVLQGRTGEPVAPGAGHCPG